jgi:hypothetical protein
VTLVIRELARVGLLSSAAAVGGIVDKNAKVEDASLEVSVTIWPDAEEDFASENGAAENCAAGET